MRLLVIDTETGGLNPDRHSLLEVGLVGWENGKVLFTDTFYVYEGVTNLNVEAEAMEVNGIDLHRVISLGITPRFAIDRINAACLSLARGNTEEHTRLAGWNLDFDKRFLLRMYRFVNRNAFQLPRSFSRRGFDCPSILFAMAHAGMIDMDVGDVNSSSAFEYFGVEPPDGKRHTALGDAVATANLITKIIEGMKP